MSNCWCIMTPNTTQAFVIYELLYPGAKTFALQSAGLKLRQADTQKSPTQPLNNNTMLRMLDRLGHSLYIVYAGAAKLTYKKYKDTQIEKKRRRKKRCTLSSTHSLTETQPVFCLFGRQLAQCDIDSSVPIPHWELHLLVLLPIQVKRLQTHTMQPSVRLPRRKPAL